MDFTCERLTITDDPDFGCTIEFSDSEERIDEFTPVKELLHPKNKYLLIQRSYPEVEDEIDWYSVESSESETELSYRDKMIIKLSRELFEINWSGDQLAISLKLNDKEYSQLNRILKNRFKDRTILMWN
ncbi:MAG: hypothetical protein JKY52_20435 [Flavobacteriales bacterium]|nr:hypothetical protein [Flavobacteriales bacterium]